MKMDLKEIYEKANRSLEASRKIMDEFKGKEMTAEKQQEVTRLLDEVESLEKQAKNAERLADMETRAKEPAAHLPLNGKGMGGDSGVPMVQVSANVKTLARMGGYDDERIRPSGFSLEQSSYDADREVKQMIATALYWQHGRANLDVALSRLPKEMQGLAAELKDLATSPGGAGGYLVADTQRMELIALLDDMVAMRRISRVLPPIPGGSSVTPSEDSELDDATWTTELGTGSDDTVEPFGGRVLGPHPIAKRIKISRTLLRAATLLNVESWILSRLARKFSYAEENGFINGSGAQQPLGLLSVAAIAATTTATSNVLAPDDIVNWVYQLDAKYQGRARILCNQSFVRKARLLRDDSGGAGTGQYMWQPGLQQGKPNMILDFPYELSDYYPTGLDGSDVYEDNAVIATIGMFGDYYWIQDSLAFTVQRLEELYAETNQVGFIGRKETDGMVVKAAAFRHLKIKA
jgi:HK97 family phage major capsid protein